MMNSNNFAQRRHNSFNIDGKTLWNKEEEDECHKTRSIIKALTHRKWTCKSIDPIALTNRRSFMEAKSRSKA